MKPDKIISVISVAIIAMILIGEVVVYSSDYTDYSSNVSMDGSTLRYEISAEGSKIYDMVISDNVDLNDSVYIYFDENYGSKVEDVRVAVGAKELTQEYYISQLIAVLEYRHVSAEIVNAEQLGSIMNDPDSSLVCLSGALPNTVYSGNIDDPIFDWLDLGGRLYWAGNLLGAYIGIDNDVIDAPSNYQDLFFGTTCLNDRNVDDALEECASNGYTSALSLVNNKVRYGVDSTAILSKDSLPMGFIKDGYSSVTLVEFGNGMICVLGGDYSNNQRNDLAQIIASGLTPQSTIIAQIEGTVTRGTITGETVVNGTALGAYVYLGGYYPVFAKNTVF